MNVLLSIKPKYVEEIKKGTKKYEFRKSIFKNYVNLIFIYSSSPEKKIVARFSTTTIIEDHPRNLWKKCKKFSGIEEKEFFNYFAEKEKGFAIKIDNLRIFKKPLEPKELIPNFMPPQSFYYLDKTVFANQSLNNFF